MFTLYIHKIWRPFSHGIKQINLFMGYLSAFLIVICSIALLYEVLMRYLFRLPTNWILEFCIFMLIASVFSGAAYTQMKRGHVGIEVLSTLLPARLNRWRYLLADIASTMLCAFIAANAWWFFHKAWAQGWVTSSSWAPQLWIPYFFMAFGMTLLVLQYLIQIVEPLAGPAGTEK